MNERQRTIAIPLVKGRIAFYAPKRAMSISALIDVFADFVTWRLGDNFTRKRETLKKPWPPVDEQTMRVFVAGDLPALQLRKRSGGVKIDITKDSWTECPMPSVFNAVGPLGVKWPELEMQFDDTAETACLAWKGSTYYLRQHFDRANIELVRDVESINQPWVRVMLNCPIGTEDERKALLRVFEETLSCAPTLVDAEAPPGEAAKAFLDAVKALPFMAMLPFEDEQSEAGKAS